MRGSRAHPGSEPYIEAVIDAVEPLIRADERRKVGTEANTVVRAKDERIADLLEDWADLRAQVLALEPPSGRGPLVWLDDVLALIDGSHDDPAQ